jgi:hypothetical protein
MRLEMENKTLKAGGGIEKVMELENKLDDMKRLNSKYIQDIESLKKKMKEIESNPNISGLR